jgi:hypothetical protein
MTEGGWPFEMKGNTLICYDGTGQEIVRYEGITVDMLAYLAHQTTAALAAAGRPGNAEL